jgi:hypothetical protein
MNPGTTLRILAGEPCTLRWSGNQWESAQDSDSVSTAIGIDVVDIEVPRAQRTYCIRLLMEVVRTLGRP